MTLPLAAQALVVYALALALARLLPVFNRRTTLIAASVAVLALPLLALAPEWSPASPAAVAVLDSLEVLQEPPVSGPKGGEAGLSTATPAWNVGLALSLVWGLGAMLAFARLALDMLAVQRLRGSAGSRSGDVATSDRVRVPVAVGVLRPLVLLPPSAEAWSASRRSLVLAHERAHIRGHDNLWLLLARVGACVHWFNPLAGRLVGELREACEHHADEVVLRGGADPADYAGALIAVARAQVPRLGVAMARTAGLERRVRAVLSPRRRSGVGWRVLGAGLVAATAVGTATATTGADTPVVQPSADWAGVLEAEVERLVTEHDPEGVALVVLDARTGATLAAAGRGDLLDRRVLPGSVLKPFTVVAALESGVLASHPFRDGDMASILERSSNDGAIEIAREAGRPAIVDVLRRVGIEAPRGLPPKRLALADGVWVTPMQVARAWTHLTGHRSIAETVAAQTREMLVQAVSGEQATGRRAAIPGRDVAGKTGTARLAQADGTVTDRYLSSFVGLVPAAAPELVVLVSVAGPQGGDPWGGVVAAPAFRRIVESLESSR